MSDGGMEKERVLILCTGNSARSQLAEGLLRAKAEDRFEVYSAGSKPTGRVLPGAIESLAEIGINIRDAQSKSMELFLGQEFDYVLTVCDQVNEVCPVFPGPAKRFHRDFEDPAKYPEDQQLHVFRRVRDEIAGWLMVIFDVY